MSPASERKKRDWRRHLDGWQAGALLVGVAVFSASLAVPRTTPPFVLPMPAHDAARSRITDEQELERAAQALSGSLPHATRRVGEVVRRLGHATMNEPGEARKLQRQLARDVREQLAGGQAGSLLQLRALQSEFFVEAARAWERTGTVSEALRELGGDFPERARMWVEPSTNGSTTSDGGRRLVLSDQELRLLFRVRWGLLTGTHRVHPFGPGLNELRQYYSLLLTHPAGDSPHDRILNQLAAVDALGRIDADYPAAFARGVIYGKLGDFARAAQNFEQYSRSHGDGPWMLLARNHWLAARALLGNDLTP